MEVKNLPMEKYCPYCHEEMELGYIQCRDGVSWSKKKRAVAAIQPLSASKVMLATSSGPFAGAAVESYLCSKCKIILIDYR